LRDAELGVCEGFLVFDFLRMNDTFEILENNAPRCISPFSRSEKIPWPENPSHAKPVIICSYKLRCRCGEEQLLLYGSKNENGPKGCWAPYSALCPSCQFDSLIFSAEQHGYDGENGVCSSIIGTERELYHADPGSVLVRFTYDVENYAELVEAGVENPQDYFGLFEINFKRPGRFRFFRCLMEYECA